MRPLLPVVRQVQEDPVCRPFQRAAPEQMPAPVRYRLVVGEEDPAQSAGAGRVLM